MKTFFDLEVIALDPHLSLGIADGIPIALGKDESQALLALEDLLAASATASDVTELAHVAEALACQRVRVLRVDGRTVEPGSIEPGFYECLRQDGIDMCLLADPMPNRVPPIPPLAAQLAACTTTLHVAQIPISQLIGYLVAAREACLADERPSNFAGYNDDVWRVGPLSSFEQALEFAKHASDCCPSFRFVVGFTNHVLRWLESEDIAALHFDELMHLVSHGDPFAQWRRAEAHRR
jgi:hypothetical protein